MSNLAAASSRSTPTINPAALATAVALTTPANCAAGGLRGFQPSMERGPDADKPNLGGRPPFTPTGEQRAMVERLAGLLVPQAEIGRDWFTPPICRDTVRKYFGPQLRRGRTMTTTRLKLRILRAAENGSLRAAAYLLNRLAPEFAPRCRGAEDQPTATATIIVRGGLPAENGGRSRLTLKPLLP